MLFCQHNVSKFYRFYISQTNQTPAEKLKYKRNCLCGFCRIFFLFYMVRRFNVMRKTADHLNVSRICRPVKHIEESADLQLNLKWKLLTTYIRYTEKIKFNIHFLFFHTVSIYNKFYILQNNKATDDQSKI
jgi:hypothetical protein